MIEHKFFDLGNYKKIEDAAMELDKLSNYEGWMVVCSIGKRNHILVLRRVVEYAPEPQQKVKPTKKVKQPMFPEAVYQ